MTHLSRHRVPWSEEDVAQLRRLASIGESDRLIGLVMGRTETAILLKRAELNLGHGQVGSSKRGRVYAGMPAWVRYEDVTRGDAREIRRLCDDVVFPSVNLIRT